MDSADPPSLRSRLLTGIAGLLGACLLYALSVGPVVYVFAWWDLDSERGANFYLPLRWLAENTPLKAPLRQYVQWWEDLGVAHGQAGDRG